MEINAYNKQKGEKMKELRKEVNRLLKAYKQQEMGNRLSEFTCIGLEVAFDQALKQFEARQESLKKDEQKSSKKCDIVKKT